MWAAAGKLAPQSLLVAEVVVVVELHVVDAIDLDVMMVVVVIDLDTVVDVVAADVAAVVVVAVADGGGAAAAMVFVRTIFDNKILHSPCACGQRSGSSSLTANRGLDKCHSSHKSILA